MTTILIPTPLRKLTNNQECCQVEAATVEEALESLARQFPLLNKYLFDKDKNISKFLNVFVENTDIRDLSNKSTILPHESIVSIIPAIAGG